MSSTRSKFARMSAYVDVAGYQIAITGCTTVLPMLVHSYLYVPIAVVTPTSISVPKE